MTFPIEELKGFSFDAYLVGGAVRDMILNRQYKDIDIVVVGETPESMLAMGGRSVSKSFPIFLFDGLDIQFALARKDRNESYDQNEFVSLEQDLYRRDLTINSMALDRNGRLIDHYGGRKDINERILRHVSHHFGEDPHRIFRLARFAAQLDYSVADETMIMMRDLVTKDAIETIDINRITAELTMALLAPYPHRFFEILEEVGALARWLPELSSMKGLPQRPDYHAEGCVWTHNMMVLREATAFSEDLPDTSKLRIRTAALLHDIGKTKTPAEFLWDANGAIIGKHPGHESPVLLSKMFNQLASRMVGFPTEYLRFAKLIGVIHQKVHRIQEMQPKALIRLFDECGEKRFLSQDRMLEDIVIACSADHFGRLILSKTDNVARRPSEYPEGERFIAMMSCILSVKEGPIMQEKIKIGYSIPKAREAVHRARLKTLAEMNVPVLERSTDAMSRMGF